MIRSNYFVSLVAFAATIALAIGCGTAPAPQASAPSRESPPPAPPPGLPSVQSTIPTIAMMSSAFAAGDYMPTKHTCDGTDISPPLEWGEPPEGTKSFTLMVVNTDAQAVVGKAWVQWIVFDIPGDRRGLPEGVPRDAELPDGGKQGIGSDGMQWYVGPCPPYRQRYKFRLYALDTMLDLEAGAVIEELTKAMEGHVLAKGELIGMAKKRN